MSFTLPSDWIILGDGWAAAPKTTNDPNWNKAMAQTKGSYQESLMTGDQAWSGSTLKGSAKQWSSKYAASRKDLLSKLKAANVVFSFQTIGKRTVLCLGDLSTVEVASEPPTPVKASFDGPFNSVHDIFA